MDGDSVRVRKAVEVEVRDARGKPYRLKLDGDGVQIHPPISLKPPAAVPLRDLRRALSELEASLGDG